MSHSVLVVEDHADLRILIEQMLTRQGYEVRCAATVADAVAALNEKRSPCLILWDPTTLPMNGSLIALAGRLGVHIATIPIGIMATGPTADGRPIIAKKLTSFEALLTVLREHCSLTEAEASV
jgi:DNA-binding NtrC family response regulator